MDGVEIVVPKRGSWSRSPAASRSSAATADSATRKSRGSDQAPARWPVWERTIQA